MSEKICVEFLGIARAGKSTTAKALREDLSNNNIQYIDFSEFQKTKKIRKYFLIIIGTLKNIKTNDFKFIYLYILFLYKIYRNKNQLDKKRFSHPIKYYFIKKYLLDTEKIVIIEDGATHILAGFSFVDIKLQKIMLDNTITLLVIHNINIEDAVSRAVSFEKLKPWKFNNKEDFIKMYNKCLSNQNELLSEIYANKPNNMFILNIEALDNVSKKVYQIKEFILNKVR